MLLDEPIASLDVLHQHQTFTLIRALAAAEGIAVVAVMHDLNLALQYADRVTLLSRGAVYASGYTREVITPAALRDCFGLEAKLVQPCEASHPLVLPMMDTAPACAAMLEA